MPDIRLTHNRQHPLTSAQDHTASGLTPGHVLTASAEDAFGWAALPAGVPPARLVSTSAPLTGGGDLSADRTLGLGYTANLKVTGTDLDTVQDLQTTSTPRFARLGIGANPSAYSLVYAYDITATGTAEALYFHQRVTAAADGRLVTGITGYANLFQNGKVDTQAVGARLAAYANSDSGTASAVTGLSVEVGNNGLGTVNAFYGVRVWPGYMETGGTNTYFYGLVIEGTTKPTYIYGIRSRIGSGTNRWNLYLDGSAANYLAGNTFIGVTTNQNATQGLTISQGAYDDEILSLQSTDVSHSFTTHTEAATYGVFRKRAATLGGLKMVGLAEATGVGLQIEGWIDSTDPSDTLPAIVIRSCRRSGTTTAGMDNAETLLQIQNFTTARITVLGDGSLLLGTTTGGMTAGGSIAISQDLAHRGSKVGFYNTSPATKPTVTDSRGGNAALASLLAALAGLGLIVDSTSA